MHWNKNLKSTSDEDAVSGCRSSIAVRHIFVRELTVWSAGV